MSSGLTLELFVQLELRAEHRLEEREERHPHTWDIEVGLRGEVREGRIISLPRAHEIFSQTLRPLVDTFLNENSWLDLASRDYPTCENLGIYLFHAFGQDLERAGILDVQVTTVRMGVKEATGIKLGYASLTREVPTRARLPERDGLPAPHKIPN